MPGQHHLRLQLHHRQRQQATHGLDRSAGLPATGTRGQWPRSGSRLVVLRLQRQQLPSLQLQFQFEHARLELELQVLISLLVEHPHDNDEERATDRVERRRAH